MIRRAAIASIVAGGLLASSAAHADKEDPFDGETVSLQFAGGLLTGAVIGAGAGLIGAGIGQLINSRDWGVPLVGAALGVLIGGSIGIVGGVDHVGDQQGANGTVLGTSLALAGGLISLGTFQFVAAKSEWKVPTSVNLLLGLTTLIGFPIVGYHLTADRGGEALRVQVPIASVVF